MGGGSNAIGMFHPFIGDASVEIIGIEAGGTGKGLGQNAATLAYGRPGVLQGAYSLLLQDENGQIQETHSVSAGLDYPGRRSRAFAAAVGRARALRSRHRRRIARRAHRVLPQPRASCRPSNPRMPSPVRKRWARENPGKKVLIGLSGRGDKDMPTLQRTVLAGSK